MNKPIQTLVVMPMTARPIRNPFLEQGERGIGFARRTGVLTFWLRLMFIGVQAVLLSGASARAANTLYNIQFNPSSSYQQTGAAIIGQSGDYWNRLTSSGTSTLTTSASAANGVSFTWAGNGPIGGSVNSSFGNGDANLMGGYIYSSSSQDMTFSNLPLSAAFSLYVYTQGDSAATGRRLSVTFNGSTSTSSAAVAGATSFVLNQNYMVISGTTTAGGTLPFSYAGVSGEANINGLQLSVGPGATLATVTLSNLAQTYDATAKPVTVTTAPSGLAVGVTYNGSAAVPTNAGSYTVIATVNDANYYGGATNTLVIAKATPGVTTWPTNTTTLKAGQTLASATLAGGSASVSGLFAFTLPSTVPPDGASTQSVTFTPTDTNYNTVAGSAGVLMDSVAPTILSITRKSPGSQAENTNLVTFEVTFSESVTNVTTNSFALTRVNGSTATGAVSAVTGGPQVYEVTVTLTGGAGEFRLDVPLP